MDQVYIFMLVALFALAIIDLVVGVSNDAVNFLNSAIGSKAVSMKTIMIVASVGIGVGAVFSSGMMEVARKGIFHPESFYFEEIMIVFIAVMITDILLLDVFNSIGLPTSTTVSIVFELLGSAVAIALVKIYSDDQGIDELFRYINTEQAFGIIRGIFISVLIAFTVGAIIQYFSRLIFTFHFEKNLKYTGGIFGGLSITAISYFILFKGLKGVSFIPSTALDWVNDNTLLLLGISFVVWTAVSQLLQSVFKVNILRLVIIIGTFALAMAFAGNDLVNFIGVPLAAYNSYGLWVDGGMQANFTMEGLAGKVPANSQMLFLAGLVMIVTLWFSKKARAVVETGVNLARQNDGAERFEPNGLSRLVVRATVNLSQGIGYVVPDSLSKKIDQRFQKPIVKKNDEEAPAFDMVRAAVNLVVASILISVGTLLKLPLSTTYVTFMVAMGSSLADRAWGRESAVYRVAGVFNVIGGWFVTALVAFVTAAIFATIIYFGGIIAIVGLLILASLLLLRSYLAHKKSEKEKEANRKFDRTDLITINEIINESSDNISKVIRKVNHLYTGVIDNLGLQDLGNLKKNKKDLKKLEDEVDGLKSDVFYFIKSLDDTSVEASKFYILILDYLQDMVQSIGYITKNSFGHVNNNHKNLKFNQIRDLKGIDKELQVVFNEISKNFANETFDDITDIIYQHKELREKVSVLIQKQIDRIRTTETSPKNTKLYFSLLLETQDLIGATIKLLELFQEFHRDYNKIIK
ncbi:Phosphate transporter family protein [Pustulibacterium marinum]|uniref:Phosphate transporter n=1 Tax=Pustulibacterium marinum TaxID=1224947 RepID=A0A1I7H9K6_9FLAO|nr:inorganic phosphate transporter [Pustulibacterium marinum]SFU57411.1 Phosphate transporter family protein [Pustulibacterium marinum]